MEVFTFTRSGCRSVSARARLGHTVPITHDTKHTWREGCGFSFLLYVMLRMIRKSVKVPA